MFKNFVPVLLVFLSVGTASHTAPPQGAKVVALSGGQYKSLQAAIDSISKTSMATTTIFIQPGTYTGQTNITSGYKGRIIIQGYTQNEQSYLDNEVILTNNLSSTLAGGNVQSSTLRIQSPNVAVYNLRVENTAGAGSPAHALTVSASHVGFYGCAFKGYQDTVYGQYTDTLMKSSYVEGATDFIYGGRNCTFWLENCDIAFNRDTGGYITASGRESDDDAWYVINGSQVFAKPGISVKAGSVYLGRPWRAYARVVYQNTNLSNIISPQGWNPWDKSDDLSHIYYAEYLNAGSGANISQRVPWSHQLSSPISMDTAMPGWEAWVDQSY
ncbi:uncharacterized protein TrAFT101_000189 [Trichoderma asperellum]|uniref:uncharacterized protein n=1 Tax=Trichoderma asperellum TaxID=101201 RepID=UPI00331C1F52|nr:hypothetical protein TrAFT101_000189 [Trichoderma asperellum]